MIRVENGCVGCPDGSGCLGHSCPVRRIEIRYCDVCRCEISDDEEYYLVDGEEICEDCLKDKFAIKEESR